MVLLRTFVIFIISGTLVACQGSTERVLKEFIEASNNRSEKTEGDVKEIKARLPSAPQGAQPQTVAPATVPAQAAAPAPAPQAPPQQPTTGINWADATSAQKAFNDACRANQLGITGSGVAPFGVCQLGADQHVVDLCGTVGPALQKINSARWMPPRADIQIPVYPPPSGWASAEYFIRAQPTAPAGGDFRLNWLSLPGELSKGVGTLNLCPGGDLWLVAGWLQPRSEGGFMASTAPPPRWSAQPPPPKSPAQRPAREDCCGELAAVKKTAEEALGLGKAAHARLDGHDAELARHEGLLADIASAGKQAPTAWRPAARQRNAGELGASEGNE